MKKLLILLLALILMLPLCGCEKDKPIDDNNNNDNTDNSSFSKVVAVDNQECSIVIKGVDLKNSAGLALKAELINKSGSKTLMFSIKEATINGVDCETMFSWMGAPKEKYNVIYLKKTVLVISQIFRLPFLSMTLITGKVALLLWKLFTSILMVRIKPANMSEKKNLLIMSSLITITSR